MRLLDLFCGRWGWSRAFAARGWECVGVDLVEPPEIPDRCEFFRYDILKMWSTMSGYFYNAREEWPQWSEKFDFICASPPCEEFSLHGMKMFHPNPPYPEMGIKLFNHTRSLCEYSSRPYVMENVRPAQMFVGSAVHHAGPFYLWGNAVPPLMPQGIVKGFKVGWNDDGKRHIDEYRRTWHKSKARAEITAKRATIPVALAACVADYAERICEGRTQAEVVAALRQAAKEAQK